QETLHVNFMENKPNVAGSGHKGKSLVITITRFRDLNAEFEECTNNSSNGVNAASSSVSTAGLNFINSTNDFSAAGPSNTTASPTVANSSSQDASTSFHDSDRPNLEDLTHSDDADDVGAKADINNLESIISVSPILTTRIHKDHLTSQIIGDLSSTTHTRSMARAVRDQGHTQEEGIDYEEVFAPVARIEAIRLFLAYASFMGFIVYQMDVKSAFFYGTIEEEVYVCQPPGFEDPENPDKVYKVVKALYGLHQAPRACYDWSFQEKEKPTNYAIMAFTSLSSSSSDNESDESWPSSPIYDRYQSGDRYHDVPPPYTGTFMPPKPDMVFNNAPNDVETVHTAFNVVLSPTKPDTDLSYTHRPSAPIIEDWVSGSKDESEATIPQNVLSFVQPTKQVKSPRLSVQYVETSIPPANPKTASPKPKIQGYSRNRKECFSKLVPIPDVRPVTTDVPKTNVTRPRQAKTVVTKPNSPPRRHINRSPSLKASNFPPKVTATKAPMVNAAQGVQGKWEWKPKCLILDCVSHTTSASMALKRFDYNDTLGRSKSDKEVIDSGCSRHMTGNMFYLSKFEELNGGYITFGGNPKGGKISRKCKIRIGKLDFDDVYFVKELKFNLFSVSQMYDKKNSVLFTDTECLVLSLEFKLPDENQVLLRDPRENNMRSVDLKNIIPSRDLTCLFAKATLDESNLWHRRIPNIGFMRPFGCPVTILNILDSLGKFDGKVDEGFLVGYSEPEFEGRKPESEVNVSPSSSALSKKHDDKTRREAKGKSHVESLTRYRNLSAEFEDFSDNSINEDNNAGTLVLVVGQLSPNSTNTFSDVDPSNAAASPTHRKSSYMDYSQLSDDLNMLELEDITYSDDEDDVGAEADFNNLETSITVSPIPTTRVHKDHPVTQIIGDLSSTTQTRSMTMVAKDQGGLSQIKNDDFHTCMFVCFRSQEEPKREEGIDYEEVFVLVEEVYVCQPLRFEDPDYPYKIYVDDIIFGSTNKELCKAFEKLMKDKFQMSSIGELTLFLGLQVKQKKDGTFISQDKYVAEILRKFGLTDGKSASTPIDTEKPLIKDPDGEDVDVYTYRLMIGSLMYLTSSRPDIMFAVCTCAHFQVTPKASHLHAVKRIFRYLKGKPYLGLWYPKDSPFNLVAYSDSDYAGASLDRKSTTRGCQFLGCRLISWQCKKQTVVATSSTETEYVAVASCCAQVL
nr:hypothetical protein [Tanacetum cinerariifolium]